MRWLLLLEIRSLLQTLLWHLWRSVLKHRVSWLCFQPLPGLLLDLHQRLLLLLARCIFPGGILLVRMYLNRPSRLKQIFR
jgi:hypothetical protein